MRRGAAILALALLLACVPATAAAQGLYDPFPQPQSRQKARDFLRSFGGQSARLADILSDRELERGLFVPGVLGATLSAPLRGATTAGPESRARAGGDFGPSSAWPVVLLLALAASATVFAIARGRAFR
jgi:hypothetical protein